MDVSSSTNAAQSSQAQSPSQAAQDDQQLQMGKEDFLQLLVAQLKSQDPMNPLKGQEFAAQLAQFSSLEQLLNINETLGNQSTSNGRLANRINSSMATNLLGKEVQATGNSIQWLGEADEVPLSFELTDPASDVTITIRDATGEPVFKQEMGSLSAGLHDFAWDGADGNGNEVPRGNYTFSVEAVDSDGNAVETTSYLNGTVDRVTFGSDSGPLLWVNDNPIPMDQVLSVVNP